MSKYFIGRRMNSDEEFTVLDLIQVNNLTLNTLSEAKELLHVPTYEDIIIYEINDKWEIDMFSSLPLNQCPNLVPF